MANKVVSLAYYVYRAKLDGATQDVLKALSDYQTNLPGLFDQAASATLWNQMFGSGDTLVPLDRIDLSQTDFQDVVDQLFRGTQFLNVRLSAVAAPPLRPAHAPFLDRYLATIPRDTRTPKAISATMDRVEEVISNRAVASARANGLVVGRVQSGKTRNYIGLMLKAADEGWNVIIVLTSPIKTLAKQTRDRIAQAFSTAGADNRQMSHELDFIDGHALRRRAGAELDGDFFYWGVSMKQVNGLDRIRRWLDIPNQPHVKMRVLIIDDEADNATPDSHASGGRLLEADEIGDRIDVIRHTPGYSQLAEWFDDLLARTWPDSGADTPDAKTFRKICDLFRRAGVSTRQKRDQIVNVGEYRRFLDMARFSNPPVEQQIQTFFSGTRGNDDRTCRAFVLLFNSILSIVRGRSAINAAVCRLIGPDSETGAYAYPFARCAYLGYTATPYANILNEGPGKTPLYADFIQSLEIPPQYFGAEAIFGMDETSYAARMPIVPIITEDEENLVLAPLREADADIDEDLVFHNGRDSIEWSGLKHAVAWAFCAAAVRRRRRKGMADPLQKDDQDNRWTTFLANVDHKQITHGSVRSALDRFLDARCASNAASDAFIDFCKSVWDEETARFPLKEFTRLFNSNPEPSRNYGHVDDYPDWKDVRPEIEWFLRNRATVVHAVVFNSTAGGLAAQKLYNQYPEDLKSGEIMQLDGDHLWFVSGGNTIGRGLTLRGLSASYFDRVRERTCVDTIAQMGRWFGYRPGYELLPRIWTNETAVAEMKRIARLESRLHESIADNFAQKFSPSDPAHFQQIVCWGRHLSGRDAAVRALDANIGTTASTDDFRADPVVRGNAFSRATAFLAGLGPCSVRDPARFLYANTPLWENVDRLAVRRFLESILGFYPDRSRQILRGLVRDIDGSDDTAWDVVLGNPKTARTPETSDYGVPGVRVRVGSPDALSAGPGILRTSSARLHGSFYAMIPSEFIFREDVSRLKIWRGRVADGIDAKRIQNGGILPVQYDSVLPGRPSDPVLVRLDQLIDRLERANGAESLPDAIHARLGDVSQGLRNRSSAEYMAAVHRSANHTRPVLQLYLIRPHELADGAPPLLNVSFYWPDHEPSGFFTVAVDGEPAAGPAITPGVFCRTIKEILDNWDFPMQRGELLNRFLARHPRASEAFFDQHIAKPLDGFAYHRMKGRNAYCRDGWATDEEARLWSELLTAAVAVLQREATPFATRQLLEKTIAGQPKLRDFFIPGRHDSEFNARMTPPLLAANHIGVTNRRPVTYLYQP